MSFPNKLVALVNKEIEIGVALNAVAHASIAMAAQISKVYQVEDLKIENYKDASQNVWPISSLPYIILRGKSNEIKKAVFQAKEQGILQVSFLESMTKGTYLEQMERTSQTLEENLIFYSAVLFGPWDAVSQITKRFSLYK